MRVVRAVLGQAVSHLSKDERDIETTFELLNQKVLFSAKQAGPMRPGMVAPAITVTQPGGTVSIDGFTATVKYDNSANLRSGMDIIALLHDQKGRHVVAGAYGIFQVRDSLIVPLVQRSGEHNNFAGMQADAFINKVLDDRKKLVK